MILREKKWENNIRSLKLSFSKELSLKIYRYYVWILVDSRQKRTINKKVVSFSREN